MPVIAQMLVILILYLFIYEIQKHRFSELYM
jgi:hypothetical protein